MRGLGLMDWPVNIAIPILAIGLSLPAINTNCTVSKVAQCPNNERHNGVAFLEYEDHHGVFPSSTVEGAGSGSAHTCFLLAMPGLERIDQVVHLHRALA